MSNHSDHTDGNAGDSTNELKDIMQRLMQQMHADESMHADLLAQLHERLAALGAEVNVANVRIPDNFRPALKNIEAGLTELSRRIEEAGAGQIAVSQQASGLLDMPSAPTAPAAPYTPPTATHSVSAQSMERSVARPPVLDPELGHDPDNPWDQQSAEALSQVYDSADTGFTGPFRDPEHAAYDRMQTASAAVAPAHAGVHGAPAPHAAAIDQASHSSDKVWLEARFAEIAERIERGQPNDTSGAKLQHLSERIELLETRFTQAIEDVANRSDNEGLQVIEQQIDVINQNLKDAELKYSKLDTIQDQLASLVDQTASMNVNGLLEAQPQITPEVIESVASAVAQKTAMEVASAAASQAPALDNDRVGDMQNALMSFMEERRHGEAQSQSVLNTMEEAMIQVLDRVDAIERGVQTKMTQSAPTQPAEPVGLMSAPVVEQLPTDAPSGEDVAGTGLGDVFADRMTDLVEPNQPELPQQSEAHAAQPEAAAEDLEFTSNAEVDAHPSDAPAEEPAVEAENVPPQLDEAAELARERLRKFADQQSLTDVPEAAAPQVAEQPHQEQAAPESAMPEEARPEASAPEQPPEVPGATAQDELAPPATQQKTHDSIMQMRQDLIANAQKARARAEAEAETSGDVKEKKKGFTLGLGRSDKKDVEEKSERKGGGLLGFKKKKMIVAVLFAACSIPALTLMMDDKLVAKIASHVPAMTAQTSSWSSTVHSADVQLEKNPGYSEDVLQPDRVVPGQTTDTSAIYHPTSEILDADAIVNGAPTGLTVYNSGAPLKPEDVVFVDRRQETAEDSAKLGKYYVPVLKSDEATDLADPKQALANSKPIVRGNARRALGMPPAMVGPTSLRLAAAKGNPSAQFQVAMRLAEAKGTLRDAKGAFDWFQRSANQGFAQSQYRLGTLYERGLGVTEDHARAETWYRRAALQGHIKSMHNLAVLRASAKNKAPDYSTAATWFEQAADYGLADSQFNLAVLYQSGLGVTRDLQQAYKFYALAAKKGDQGAIKRRDSLISEMSTDELEAAEKLVAAFRAKRQDRMVNDARVAGQAWKSGKFNVRNLGRTQ